MLQFGDLCFIAIQQQGLAKLGPVMAVYRGFHYDETDPDAQYEPEPAVQYEVLLLQGVHEKIAELASQVVVLPLDPCFIHSHSDEVKLVLIRGPIGRIVCLANAVAEGGLEAGPGHALTTPVETVSPALDEMHDCEDTGRNALQQVYNAFVQKQNETI